MAESKSKEVSKYGSQGIVWVAVGAVLLSLRGLTLLPSLLIGGILTYIGFVFNKKPERRKTSLYIIGAGLLTLVTSFPFLGKISKILLSATGFILLGAGVISFILYVINRPGKDE